jgi:hypothetical protein
MESMVLAYMRWCASKDSSEKIWTLDNKSDDEADEDSELYNLIVVDMFGKVQHFFATRLLIKRS